MVSEIPYILQNDIKLSSLHKMAHKNSNCYLTFLTQLPFKFEYRIKISYSPTILIKLRYLTSESVLSRGHTNLPRASLRSIQSL
nr:MAG TPA: hypothetical protein [Caudoviricetes sp.]